MITRKWLKIAAGLCLAAVLIVVIIIVIILTKSKTDFNNDNLAIGAVVSNGGPCAEIGLNILRKYENAIDSMIATMLCDGITTMNNMGIGGGFIATIYIKSEGKAYSLNARETAPAKSTVDMFNHNQTLSQTGGLSVAVPGELRGYRAMYDKFGGKAPWPELFYPTIKLCKEGVPINKHIATNIATYTNKIKASPTLYALLRKPDGSLPVEGDKVKLPKLAETLTLVAENGPDVLYNGILSPLLINDITKDGGIMTVQDLASYSVRWEEPVTISLKEGSLKMYSVPLPGSGNILGLSLSLVDGLLPINMKNSPDINITKHNFMKSSSYIPDLDDTFAITEAFKYSYAIRSKLGDPYFHNTSKEWTKLEDPKLIKFLRNKVNVNVTSSDPNIYGADYLKEDHGTANMAVLAPNGDAVVATSTVNLIFGSKLVSESTGIILNDEMDDFSVPGIVNYFGVPPSSSNFVVPGARPLSSMCPAIFVDTQSGDVRLAIGAAGGTRITTATAVVALRALWYNISLPEAVSMPRFHHQLIPMVWLYDPGTSQDLVDGMAARGHVTKQGNRIDSCVTGILRRGQLIDASSDMRRPGNVSYLYQVT